VGGRPREEDVKEEPDEDEAAILKRAARRVKVTGDSNPRA
jgi:hypothetical protein